MSLADYTVRRKHWTLGVGRPMLITTGLGRPLVESGLALWYLETSNENNIVP
jgi:hypothetical protein